MLTELRPIGKGYSEFLCFCGTLFKTRRRSVAVKDTISCGCYKREIDKQKARAMGKANKTHGLHGSLTWKTWDSMKQRCHNPKAPDYKHYGKRGIKVRYKSITELVSDIGLRPSINHSIDRINNDGNYEAGNCEWVTKSENTRREMVRRVR